MDWSGANLAESMGFYRQKMTLYLEDESVTDQTAQARKVCRGIGDEGLRQLNASGLTADEKKDPDKLWEFFERQLHVHVNFRIHRLSLCSIASAGMSRWTSLSHVPAPWPSNAISRKWN